MARVHQALVEGDLASTLFPVPPIDPEDPRDRKRDPGEPERVRTWLEANVRSMREEVEEGRLGHFEWMARDGKGDTARWLHRAHLDRCEKHLGELRRGLPPQPTSEWWAEDIQWEHPIANQRGTVIGYVDLRALIKRRSWSFDIDVDGSLQWVPIVDECTMYFDAKPEIPSVGELLRQINKYRHYRSGGMWVVVTPSEGYAGVLASQGVKLLVPNRVDQQLLPFGLQFGAPE